MPITEEQFNKLVTSDEFFERADSLENKVDSLEDNFAKVFDTLDYIVKKLDNVETENISNLEAHKRINRDLHQVKKHTGLKTMEVAETND